MMYQKQTVLLWCFLVMSCREPICGNEHIEAGEECDDGNGIIGDGCHPDCREESTQSYLVSSLEMPKTTEDLQRLSIDLNEDGVIDSQDNGLVTFQGAFSFFGKDAEHELDLSIQDGAVMLGADIIAADFDNDQALFLSYKAALLGEQPNFDGSDFIFAIEKFDPVNATIRDGTSNAAGFGWVFPLVYQANTPIFLPLRNARASGRLARRGMEEGVLAGTVNAIDFATSLRQLADVLNERLFEAGTFFGGGQTPIFCSNQEQCPSSGICTDQDGNTFASGFCVSSEDAFLLAFFDDDSDGLIEVSFNEPSLTFFQNELAILFDLRNLAPEGIIGNLFVLDTNDDSIRDSMGVGLGFTAAPAIRLP